MGFFNFLFGKPETKIEPISSEVIEKIFKSYDKNVYTYFTGSAYYPVRYNDVVKFLDNDYTDRVKYDEDKYNCVNFTVDVLHQMAKKFPDGAFGYIDINKHRNDGVTHVCIWFIDTDLVLRLIEPQNDDIFPFEYGWDIKVVFRLG